jgi:hypothetical protein
MASITFNDAELVRSGTIVTCFIGGRALARVNLEVMGATSDAPLTIYLADRKFVLTLEQTAAFLEGMPKPEPKAEPVVEASAEVASEAAAAEVVEEAVVEEAVAPRRRGRRA